VKRAGWLFVAPALLLVGVFFVLPLLAALLLSFTDFDIYAIGRLANARFVGLRNYADLLDQPLFWTALRNTLYLVVVGGPLSVLVSLAMALLLHSRLVRWRGFFRAVYFAPVVTTLVAVAVVWRYLYHPTYGPFNQALALVGLPRLDWLGDPRWSIPALILFSVWKNFGYNMLIFLAGLQSIPAELHEAAGLDGAGAWQRFRHVTLPHLGPTFVLVGVLTMVAYFQLFAEPYVMTQGGPLKSTTTVMLLMYEEGFRWWRMGVAAAISFLLFVVALAGTLVQLRLQRRAAAGPGGTP
jgi:multiple sugar transport system permease protein